MAECSELFLFRDDLDAALEDLEVDDIVDEYFEEAATEECKSVGGLTRHITCKHKDEKDNDPETDEGVERKCTKEMFAKVVEEVKRRLVNNIFSKDIREDLSAYQFTNISEESKEFAELLNTFQEVMEKKGQEKFYAMFYSTVPLNSTN